MHKLNFHQLHLTVSPLLLSLTLSFSAIEPAQAAGKDPVQEKLEKADQYLREDHAEKAKDMLIEVVKARPKNAIAWVLLGQAFQDLGVLDRTYGSAKQCYLKALEIQPNMSRAYTKMGELSAIDGDYVTELGYLEKALKCPNPDKFALKAQAVAYSNLKRDKMALESYMKFMAHPTTNKDNPIVLKSLANLQENAGKYDDCLLTLDKLEKPGKKVEYEHQRARCYEKSGKTDKAISIYSAMLSVKGNEGDELALSKRAELYERLGRYKEAMKDLDTLVSGEPSASAYKKRAALWQKMGNPARARQDLEKSNSI